MCIILSSFKNYYFSLLDFGNFYRLGNIFDNYIFGIFILYFCFKNLIAFNPFFIKDFNIFYGVLEVLRFKIL